jgi:adenosine deaminase
MTGFLTSDREIGRFEVLQRADLCQLRARSVVGRGLRQEKKRHLISQLAAARSTLVSSKPSEPE